MSKIHNLNKQIDFNNLTYYFKSKDISPINFIGFEGPLRLYISIFGGDITIEKVEKDRKQFKLDLIKITRGNLKNK